VLPERQWPDQIKKLTPNKFVRIEVDRDGFTFLRMVWGSPFGQFGIVVGPKDWTIMEKSKDYYCLIENGVYFWRHQY
jgi:hypothetical protein